MRGSPDRKHLGVVGVDSGRLIITDPSYIASEWTPDVVERCHDVVAPPAVGGQIAYRRGHKGLGVAFLAGLGDGLYDVYADYADTSLGRRITRVTVAPASARAIAQALPPCEARAAVAGHGRVPLYRDPRSLGSAAPAPDVQPMNTRQPARTLARDLCCRSTCQVQMAAVLADAHGIFAWGWNHCGGDGFGEHAEAHALRRANRRRLRGATATVYGVRRSNQHPVTGRPCERCLRTLADAGVAAIEYFDKTSWRREPVRIP